MTDRFAGMRFLVTGAAGGIGWATARFLIQRGTQVILWDADAERLGETAQALASACTVVDVTDVERVEQAAAQIIADVGGLDGVIHCGGVACEGMFEQISPDDHRLVAEVNLLGTLALAHTLLPYLKESRGSLVLLASVAGFYGPSEFVSYGATKAAIKALAQALRVELAGSGVYIGVVSPHLVDTPMYQQQTRKLRLSRAQSPLLAVNTADQAAEAILRGIEHRQFMSYVGWRARLIFIMSRCLHLLAHAIMVQTWRSGASKLRHVALPSEYPSES